MDLSFHPAANIFPLLEDKEFEALVEDIRKHGLRDPIELFDGKILDGRNRYRACLFAKIKPATIQISPGDPIDYVLSKNLHRRHLNSSQAGVCAAKAEKLREKLAIAAKEREKIRKGNQRGTSPDKCPDLSKGDTRDQLGAIFGVSGKTVDRARKALERGCPDVVKALETGEISVNMAAQIADHPPELQRDLLRASLPGSRRGKPRKTKPAGKTGDAVAWQTRRVSRDQLEALAAIGDELHKLTDLPTDTVSVVRVRKRVRELRERISELLS